jgi:hypothetical protein
MESFLTLVIAVGSIATGIGAMWAALVARHQARVTERSLAEQNEQARLNLEYDLLTKLTDRFSSPRFLSRRGATAKYLLDNAVVDDDVVAVVADDGVVPVEDLNKAVFEVCNFFEEVGEMLRRGVLSAVPVWSRFSDWVPDYWSVCKPTIEKLREDFRAPAIYEDFEYLARMMTEMNRKRGVAPTPREQLRRSLKVEAAVGNEPPTTTE